MIYLVTKMMVYLIAAGLIGLTLGWVLRSLAVEKARKLVEYSHQDKLDALLELHQEELAEFAENAKQSRADLARLETNNKALRDTIATSSTALELAKTEVAQLSAKLKSSDAFNKEILEVTGHHIEEFDKTIEVRDQSLDGSNIEVISPVLDDSLAGTQDNTMLEGEVTNVKYINSVVEEMESRDGSASEPEKADDEPVEITMGNLWSHIGQVVGTKTKN